MSTTRTMIGEHDVVALRKPVDGWPAGTEGTVISVFPTHRWVEVGEGQDDGLDIVSARPEELQLIWKCPPSSSARESAGLPAPPPSPPPSAVNG